MKTTEVRSGGIAYPAVWLQATVKPSKNPDLVIACVNTGDPEPLVYDMPAENVRTNVVYPNSGPGEVLALLLGADHDRLHVRVLGEEVTGSAVQTVAGNLAA